MEFHTSCFHSHYGSGAKLAYNFLKSKFENRVIVAT